MDDLVGLLREKGATVVGFADLADVPEELTQGLPRAVSMGVALTPTIVAGIMEGPTDEYWGEYGRLNALLLDIARAGAELLVAGRWRAHSCQTTGDTNLETLTAPFPHKTAARLAGLGWIGKCALLVNPEYGSAVRWNTILTDAPLPTSAAPLDSRCGACSICVDVCPGHAASGRIWEAGMGREDFWDAQACLAGTQKITAARQTISRVCGLCLAVCPHTVAYLKRDGVLAEG